MNAYPRSARGKYGSDIASIRHSMLGLAGLFEEMAAQGIAKETLLKGTGIVPEALDDASARMTHQQKILLFQNVFGLARLPDVGLRAGQRQRLSDFGVYGYALSSSSTFGEAVSFGIQHIKLAGPVLEKSFRVEGDVAVFEGHDVLALGELLPLVSEFWFCSINTLITRIMERPLPAYRLLLPYPAPAYADAYAGVFGCPVEFGSGSMQWHFDPTFLEESCPNANRITADMCKDFCKRMLESLSANEPELVGIIRTSCLNSGGGFTNLEEMAEKLHVSSRTLHRRLVEAGYTYQDILDDVRRRLAEEFLRNTDLTIEEISGRVGFSDASNFRKAFKKWAGKAPAEYRSDLQATRGSSSETQAM